MASRILFLKNASGTLGYVRKIVQPVKGVLQDFSQADTDYFAQADDPTYLDGMVTRDPAELDNLFKVGWAKVYDPAITTVRNVTVSELADCQA